MTNETDRNPDLDCYGMTPALRAAFEAWAFPENLDREFADGVFLAPTTNIAAITWAACAKLHRERLREAQGLMISALDSAETHIAEQEARAVAAADHLQSKVDLWKEMALQAEAEVERLRADAERLDYISTERLIVFARGRVEVISPDGWGEGGTLRYAIDEAMKGGA